jgi:malate dehydrogenase (oxaloacetate-decarboxylating)
MPQLSRWLAIRTDDKGNQTLEVALDGMVLLQSVLTNKGTAFTQEERRALRLDGLLPPAVSTLEQQLDRSYRGFKREPTPLSKYQYLRQLQSRNEILFYALLERHLKEMLPIVYTPTVGEAVQQFNYLYQSPRGLSFSPLNIERAPAVLESYPLSDVRMIVATDSSAILGIGDQGYGGLAIPIGKLALYVTGGGVSPFHTMPVALDVGTNRQDLIDDPYYLGVRQKRLRGEDYLDFIDRFVDAIHQRWPRAVIQWEDLAKDAAFTVLERYRKRHPSFNDDIQGTGAVALAGVLNACRVMGRPITEQTIVIHGAGAGGVGVAWAIRKGLERAGLPAKEARARVLVLDSKGLLTEDRDMEGYKRDFAQSKARIAGWEVSGESPSLLETVRGAKATVLLGLSGQPGAFSEPVLRAMAANTKTPVVFPLSNPTSSAEALPEDVIAWTKGCALVATGSPFDPVTYEGKTFTIGQGNNAFIFPGLGLGASLCEAREVTDGMVLEAAFALSEYTAERHPASLYPPVEELQAVSHQVAARVIRQALADGVVGKKDLDAGGVEALVTQSFWRAKYLPTVKVPKL